MITEAEAHEIQGRLDKLTRWVDTIRGKNGWASWRPEDKPRNVPDVTNDERSALEVFVFCTERPDRYTLYVNEAAREATTWMGDRLGEISFGRAYRDNFGGTRVPIRVQAINGRTYSGTYYKSSGDYAHVRAVKP